MIYLFDFAYKKQLSFQDPATPTMEGIIDLHNDIMYYMILIGSVVFWSLAYVIYCNIRDASDFFFVTFSITPIYSFFVNIVNNCLIFLFYIFPILFYFGIYKFICYYHHRLKKVWLLSHITHFRYQKMVFYNRANRSHFFNTAIKDKYNYLTFFKFKLPLSELVHAGFIRFMETTPYQKQYIYGYQNFNHCAVLEIIWTVIPSIILLLIALPSFNLLYSLDSFVQPGCTFKAIGHQWYWTYEYTEYDNSFFKDDDLRILKYDSYLKATNYKSGAILRLLDVDKQALLPANMHIRVLVSSSDVLHSWAVPSLGIKLDACPGRLNETFIYIKRVGVFYGQCSEICGINHGFMPIVVNVVDDFYLQLRALCLFESVTCYN